MLQKLSDGNVFVYGRRLNCVNLAFSLAQPMGASRDPPQSSWRRYFRNICRSKKIQPEVSYHAHENTNPPIIDLFFIGPKKAYEMRLRFFRSLNARLTGPICILGWHPNLQAGFTGSVHTLQFTFLTRSAIRNDHSFYQLLFEAINSNFPRPAILYHVSSSLS